MANVLKYMNINCTKFAQGIYLRHMCFSNSELIKPGVAPDILMQHLKTANTPKNVLDLVSTHYHIMNSKHSMQALRSIFELQKGQTDMSMKEILSLQSFDKLCKKLKLQAGVIEINETLEALKVVSYLGVPSDSVITQTLLQLIRQNVNSLSLNHIIFLEFLLNQFKSTHLVDALKIALPLVFEIHLPYKVDPDNLNQLAEFLYYASRERNITEKTTKTILQHLENYQGSFDAKTAKSILWSLCQIEPKEYFAPLLKKALNDIIVHIDDLSFNDMDITLSKLVHRYSRKFPFYYDEVFYDTCANYVIDNNLGYKEAQFVLKKFVRINHFNRYLLDYICTKIFDENQSEISITDIYSLVCIISLTDYRPKNWDYVKNIIENTKNAADTTKKDANIIWIKFCASLCILDIYKLDIISKCLSEDFLNNLFKKLYMSDIENYYTIWQCIKLNKPDLIDLLPKTYSPEEFGERVSEYRERKEGFPLEPAINHLFGGPQYVITNLKSKLGHCIDHVIVFRKGGYPVSLNKEKIRFIEDIETDPDQQVLCIFGLKPILYTINTKHLRKSAQISFKMLEAEGYQVVPIDLVVWENLNDFEKLPYIMQQVKSKIECDFSLNESVSL